jgi:pimeloyl-ACP methyl ester carboxylesterase
MDDLLSALETAGERGPFVVAGHSFGGVYARILAGRNPGLVAGIVMIDAYYPDPGVETDPSLPAKFRESFGRALDETAAMLAGGEDLDWDRVMSELEAAGPFDGPAILLSVMPGARPFSADPDDDATIRRSFEATLARMFPNGRLEYVRSTAPRSSSPPSASWSRPDARRPARLAVLPVRAADASSDDNPASDARFCARTPWPTAQRPESGPAWAFGRSNRARGARNDRRAGRRGQPAEESSTRRSIDERNPAVADSVEKRPDRRAPGRPMERVAS